METWRGDLQEMKRELNLSNIRKVAKIRNKIAPEKKVEDFLIEKECLAGFYNI